MNENLESIKKVRNVVNEVMKYLNQKEIISLLYNLSLEIEDIELMKNLTSVLKDNKVSFTKEEKKSKIEI
tara:strand:- start:273 stop:482 length:210 start_codon:yes stop_codon:yes gene_type:complete